MLVEFNIKNYRSIKETQKLSLVATTDTSHQNTNCIPSGTSSTLQLLRAAVIYGANASGKSNLISALAFMRSMVEISASGIREGQALNVSAFRFDHETTNQSSEFEITFIENNIRYQYGFALNASRVTKEWLFAAVSSKPQRWFERNYDNKKGEDHWAFGSYFAGGKMQHDLWKNSTRANALFLSTAVNLNNEQLRPIYSWFVNKLLVIESNVPLNPLYTMNCVRNNLNKQEIIEFLQSADLGITDVQVQTQKSQQFRLHLEPGAVAIENQEEVDIPLAILFHQGKKENIGFNLHEESHGTQRLFAYAGPFLDILRDGKTLIVDELDSGLHPKMVKFLVSLIQNTNLNKNNAQLIFSTHNTSLLDIDYFRRDQIWFMEKDKEQASNLYPLTDFSPRKNEALEKGYLIGRYGALPYLGEFNL